ncbi:type IIL restriction-modification enzyme MmeI [Streptomyces paludis]|uniref:type IIL restriction-modification enzyme MmeI n=1 Tax=Streptomyces paludis TaxID=2282738 RepID=UPI0013B39AD0|nr:type IIL restriction-modification enzyme MmeI [Streptomyces paludis]
MYSRYWWQYAEKRPAMLKAIHDLERVLVVSLVSRTVMPTLVPSRQVLSHKLGVFTLPDNANLALMSSSLHSSWAWRNSSTMKADLNYSSSDVYETLPQPVATEQMERVGTALNELRGGIMADRQLGLTKLYNMINDRTVVDSDISSLRGVHREIDAVVTEAYGWSDLTLGHGFYSTRQGTRFTVSPRVQTEILDRLLELNHTQKNAESAHCLISVGSQTLLPGRSTGDKDGNSGPARMDALF